jgi:hypothetical protein
MAARAYGVETATAIDTVGVRFPTNTQLANGQHWLKGETASSVAKSWTLFGDGRSFYLVNATYTAAEYGADTFSRATHFFGDINSYKSADAYPALVIGSAFEGGGVNEDGNAWLLNNPDGGHANFVDVRAVARSHVGTGGAQGTLLGGCSGVGYIMGNGVMPVNPSPVDSGTLTLHKPIYTFTGATGVTVAQLRGEMPGLAQVLIAGGTGTVADRTLLTGVTGSTREFLVVRATVGSAALMAFDITGPWW